MAIALALDTETTGLLAPDHRIVEVYFGLYRSGIKIWEWETRIDPKRSIGIEAQRVHGITAGDLIGKPTMEEVAPTIAKIMSRASYYVAHNGESFDLPFIEMELSRCGVAMPKKPLVDTMLEGVWSTPDGKKPKLAELAFACGVEYDPSKAHAAAYDVDVMADSFFRGVSWGFFHEPQEEGVLLAA